jgi:zinc transport system ATP-binding protein
MPDLQDFNAIHDHVRGKACGGCCTRLVDFGVTINGSTILHDINLHVHCGELTVIMGPNGAGKTTLFKAMLGEIPHTGRLSFVHLDGTTAFTRPRVGYVPQQVRIDPATTASVLDLFAAVLSRRPLWLGRSRHVRENALAMLNAVGLDNVLDQQVSQLSGGQLQRVLLALALQPLPDLLLLDEPMAGMDAAGIDLFYRTVSRLRQQYDLSILIVSHDIEAISRVADRIIFLRHTVICDGGPGEVLAHPEVRKLTTHPALHICKIKPPEGPDHEPA